MQDTFVIDHDSSDSERLYVDVPAAAASVQITLTDEGIIVDIWRAQVSDSSVATCAATFDEISDGDKG